MRTYWSAIFSSALRVKRALFALCRRIVRSHTKAGFTSKSQAPLEKLLTIIQRETTKALTGQALLENLLTAIQHEAAKSLTGQALSDVLAAFQRMCDRRRLGIKNEAEGYGLIPLTQGKFAIVDAEDYDIRISDFMLSDNSLPNMMIQSKTNNHLSLINNHLPFGIFTTVVSALQISLFMQNKPNFRKSQMNVTSIITVDYGNETLGKRGKNKPNSNPIKPNTKPIKANKMPKQTQYKPKQTQPVVSLSNLFQRQKNEKKRVNG